MNACRLRCPGSAQFGNVLGDLEVGCGIRVNIEDGPVACADAGGACPQFGVP
jgi:hypothetical protein